MLRADGLWGTDSAQGTISKHESRDHSDESRRPTMLELRAMVARGRERTRALQVVRGDMQQYRTRNQICNVLSCSDGLTICSFL
jgi:hypothetical protein